MEKIGKLVGWLDTELEVSAFDDVANNGLQLTRRADGVRRIAVAVDCSLCAVRAAAAVGADLLIVHHGISWGGGIRRITGSAYEIVKAAMDADLAVYAAHLPLDAHAKYGNNHVLAHQLGLVRLRRAFAYRGRLIGVIGKRPARNGLPALTVGICSGGGGGYAEEAKHLGCDVFITGEADWGETIAAENCGMPVILAGHYETEVFGVRALGEALRKRFRVVVKDLTEELA